MCGIRAKSAFSNGLLGPADLVASDKGVDLALLRLYGARDLTPIALAPVSNTSEVTLIGIADPQAQGGAASISTATARLNAGSGPRLAIEPAPALGFAGAAALDRAGRLAGMVDLSVQVVAGPPPATKPQAALIPAPAIAAFLAAHKVSAAADAASGSDAAKASVVRVICVRK